MFRLHLHSENRRTGEAQTNIAHMGNNTTYPTDRSDHHNPNVGLSAWSTDPSYDLPGISPPGDTPLF